MEGSIVKVQCLAGAAPQPQAIVPRTGPSPTSASPAHGSPQPHGSAANTAHLPQQISAANSAAAGGSAQAALSQANGKRLADGRVPFQEEGFKRVKIEA
jgi:hypothetical protein